MTVRPPTLREKRRYILTRILPEGRDVNKKDLFLAIAESATSLWGDDLASRIHLSVVAIEGGNAFIRCRRGTERELAIAISTTTHCAGEKIALRALAVSGTMESLRLRLRETTAPRSGTMAPGRDVSFKGRTFTIGFCEGKKIDVIEKGFKNTTRFFLTAEDLEG